MTEREHFQWGGVSYPLAPPAEGHSLRRDADPSLYWCLEFLRSEIATKVGERLALEAARAGAAMPRAVAATGAIDPGPYLSQDARKQFPLLCVYRTTEQYNERTTVWRHQVGLWECAYVLPPLNWDQAEKLLPILHAVGQVIAHAIELGFSPTFLNGALVWSAAYARLERIALTAARYGRYPDAQGLVYHAWVGTIEVRERDHAVSGEFPPFQGGGAGILVEGAPVPLDVERVDTAVKPPGR